LQLTNTSADVAYTNNLSKADELGSEKMALMNALASAGKAKRLSTVVNVRGSNDCIILDHGFRFNRKILVHVVYH